MDTTTTKVGLAKSTYAPDPDESSLSTFASSEADCTSYTGAFGGAGRKTATVTLTEQTASNRVVAIIGDLTWSALGGASNNTLAYAIWLREITNDAASVPLAYLNFSANLTTNGSDVTVSRRKRGMTAARSRNAAVRTPLYAGTPVYPAVRAKTVTIQRVRKISRQRPDLGRGQEPQRLNEGRPSGW